MGKCLAIRSPLQSINFYSAHEIAKKLIKLGYDVRLTASDGTLVYLDDDESFVMRTKNGDSKEFRFSYDDLSGTSHWCIGWKKRNIKEKWKGLPECMILPAMQTFFATASSEDDEDYEDAEVDE